MGYIKHHCIVVTGGHYVDVAHKFATGLFPINLVSDVSDSKMNGYRSFCVFPDGSKEGWGTSDEGDVARRTFIAELRRANEVDWFEAAYGGDDFEARITDSRWNYDDTE